MSDFEKELSSEEVQTIGDTEILQIAESIVAEELKKSSDLHGAAKDEQLGKTEGDMPEKKEEDKGSAPQEANPKTKAKKEDKKMEKSQADLEGKETGGLAPSVQGSMPEAGGGSKGDSQEDANNMPHELNPSNDKESAEEKEKNKNKKKGPTQDGDAQDEANTDSRKESSEVKQGGSSAGHATQSGSSQEQANNSGRSQDPVSGAMKKSELKEELKALFGLVKSLTEKVAALEAKGSQEPLEKSTSVLADMTEKLAKSYMSQIDGLKKENEALSKSFSEKLEEVKKSNDELKKSNEDLQASLKKPARTRESLTSIKEIEKGSQPKPMFKSKAAVLEKLEDLRKSGKITADELIAYNASNILSDNAKKRLAE